MMVAAKIFQHWRFISLEITIMIMIMKAWASAGCLWGCGKSWHGDYGEGAEKQNCW